MLDMTYKEYMGEPFIMWHNDVDYSDYFVVLEVTGRSLSPNEIQAISVSGMDGYYLQGKRKPGVPLKVKVIIREDSPEDLRTCLDELNGMLDTDEPVPIRFSDEPDKTYYGMMSDISEGTEVGGVHIVTITFWRGDPYKYGSERTLLFPTDMVNIQNDGTADSDPIFELAAKKKTTFAMVSNGDEEYNIIGQPIDVTEEVISTRNLLLEERGQTLDTWTTGGTKVDGGVVDGVLSTDSDGITVPDYGDPTNNWHGPALIKNIGTAQDFEVEMNIEGRLTAGEQTFRIEFYLFDEGMNVLGKMAVLDKRANQNDIRAEGRYGPFLGSQIHYPISSSNYHYSWPDFYGILRLRRVGNKFEFYVTRVATDTKHVYSLREIHMDSLNELNGKLKYIQIHIGKYGDTPRPLSAKINYVRVYELAQASVDQTPYILYENDVVIFDHKNDDILVNGEPRSDLKNFGASFFKLKRGDNIIGVTPMDCFDAKVTYRDKYR